MANAQPSPIQHQADLTSVLGTKLSEERWAVYREVMRAVSEAHIPFAVGGGLAAMGYADQIRESKDLDLYINPDNRQPMISLLTGLGFHDYFDENPYERHWIYRSIRDGFIVDVMWAMANRRASVSDSWLRGPSIDLEDFSIHLLPAEETLWTKLYVLQRDRCDWPDALNMLYILGPDLNWARLTELADADRELLAGMVAVFRWLCPARAGLLPPWLWSRLGLNPPSAGDPRGHVAERARLLDTRLWFTPMLDEEHRLSSSDPAVGDTRTC